ncbi:cell division protein ZapA [Roseateles sp. BYS96W]|uniref:Cell division protein ZapA n=1 Tax=Pelomonas nitida TaxID=3299027 RepID=A0ABW7G5G3_9BURK
MKQMEVTIMGQSYLLGCPPGGEAALTAAVAQVDREMSAIRDGGKVKARERIAVLAALNLAYQLADAPRETPVAPPVAPNEFPEIDPLIKRLDEALGHDGQLL